jgi:hypothetical protein
MIEELDGVVFGVFIFLFLLVTVLGFTAARWRRAHSLDSLDEWGWAVGVPARSSPGSSSAVTSTPRTPASPYPPPCTPAVTSASSPSPTRSSCTR